MKKAILLFTISLFLDSNAQIDNIVNICTGHLEEYMPPGSYIKDIDNQFDKFDGIWVWADGSQTVTFRLRKVVRFLDTEYNNYRDFMIGNYSYTNNGNLIVNTINQTSSLDPELHPLYAVCPKDFNRIEFGFEDVILQKGYCTAIFEFLPGSTAQTRLTLKNPDGGLGVIVQVGDPLPPPYNYDFTIPNGIVLTKQ